MITKRLKSKKTLSERIADIFIYLICILLVIICIYPFYYVIIDNYSSYGEYAPDYHVLYISFIINKKFSHALLQCFMFWEGCHMFIIRIRIILAVLQAACGIQLINAVLQEEPAICRGYKDE